MDVVQIVDRRLRSVVDAEVVRDLTLQELGAIDDEWRQFRDRMPVLPVVPENHGWRWKVKAASVRNNECRFFAIRRNGLMQGLLMLNMNPVISRSAAHVGEKLLYVEYLESAPWNQSEMSKGHDSYGRVGIGLLVIAAQVSLEAGCGGRIALHSLVQSEGFYRSRFEDLGWDAEENLRYFELRTDEAARLLSGGLR